MKHGVLHAALGEAGPFRKLGMAETGRALLGGRAQDQVDQEGRRAVVVTDQISHKRVQDVSVDCVLLVAHRYGAKRIRAAAQRGSASMRGALMLRKVNYVGIPTRVRIGR